MRLSTWLSPTAAQRLRALAERRGSITAVLEDLITAAYNDAREEAPPPSRH